MHTLNTWKITSKVCAVDSSEGNFGHKGFGKDGHKGFGQDGGYGRGKGNAYGKGAPTLQRARFGCGATDHLLKDCLKIPSKIQLVQRYRVAGLSWEKIKGYGQRRQCHDEVPHCGKVGGAVQSAARTEASVLAEAEEGRGR